jgi:hypothetical protein
MKNKKPEPLKEYISLKEDFKNQFQKKKSTQQEAKERRKFIRELKEERYYE